MTEASVPPAGPGVPPPASEPAPAAAAPAAPALPARPEEPRTHARGSLWRDAYRRLLKNRLAVLSLVWLVVISALAGFAPWIVPFDPQNQELWVGKRGPLYAHPTVEGLMPFARDAAPPSPFPQQGSHRLRLEQEEVRQRDLRMNVDARGLVTRIELGPDLDADVPQSETPEVFKIGERERVVFGEGSARRIVTSPELKVGARVPPELAAGKTDPAEERTLVGNWSRGERTHEVKATLEGGRVAALERDGKAESRLDVSAEDVRAVELDGRPFVHTHLLGTDDSGRDILSRVIFGGRISLLVGIVATVVSLVIGVLYGAFSGYMGGRWDELLMRIVDILYAIPFMFFVIILLVLFGRNLILLFVAIGAVEWLTMARIVRGQVLSLKEKEFVEAARVSGTGPAGIILGHLVPNSLGSVIVYTTLTIPEVILTEAFLSFLGLSVQYNGQSLESWGSLTESGTRLAQGGFPWLLVWSALALSLTLFALNFLGDGLRDALDPRLRGRG